MTKGLSVHAVLTLNNQPIGVRFRLNSTYYDVELGKLRYRSKEDLKGFKTQTLIEQGNLLMTKEEIEQGIIIKDASDNERFCIAASGCLQSGPTTSTPKPQAKTQTQPQAKSKTKSKKGKIFQVEVEVSMYNPKLKKEEAMQFEATIPATNALVARKEAKEWYASEYGITPDEVTILSATLKE